jgi:putative intracellular protease/amidase
MAVPGKRMAYLVMPSYSHWAGSTKALDPAIIGALVELGLLPEELPDRHANDAAFRSTLGAFGFTVYPEVPSFSITLPVFMETVSSLVCKCDGPDDVLTIVYCGHGHKELFARHASLVLSDNRHVTSHQLDRLVRPVKGSVYTVLNCCCADAIMRVGGDSGEDEGRRRIDILSSTSKDGQKVFADVFKSVLLLPGGISPRLTPLHSLQQELQDAIASSDDVGNVVVVLLHGLSGHALGPVSEEPKVRQAHRNWGSLFD